MTEQAGGSSERPPVERDYRVGGAEFHLSTNLPAVAALLDEMLSGFARIGDGALPAARSAAYRLDGRDGRVVAVLDDCEIETDRIEVALTRLLRQICFNGLMAVRGPLVVHAGAVARDGLCVVLPGPSGSGKSTLTAALVQAGFQYLSDEVALIDLADGTVLPFPRPLGIGPRSLPKLRPLTADLSFPLHWLEDEERHVAPQQLRPDCVGTASRLALVVVPRYRSGAPSRLQPLRRSEAMLALVQNAVNFAKFEDGGLAALAEVVRRAGTFCLELDDLDQAVAEILAALDTVPRAAATSGP